MPNHDLSDKEIVKLVKYKILFLKRDLEVVLEQDEEIFHDPMDETRYASWKIAQYFQNLPQPVQEKWKRKNYPAAPPEKAEDDSDDSMVFVRDEKRYFRRLPDGDKKHLQVYFEVEDRYDRDELEYKDDKLEILREISNTLRTGVKIKNPPALAEQAKK